MKPKTSSPHPVPDAQLKAERAYYKRLDRARDTFQAQLEENREARTLMGDLLADAWEPLRLDLEYEITDRVSEEVERETREAAREDLEEKDEEIAKRDADIDRLKRRLATLANSLAEEHASRGAAKGAA